MSEAAARVLPADSPTARGVTAVNTLLAPLVGRPGEDAVARGLAALADAGIPAVLHRDPAAAPPGSLPLVAAGRELGRLELPPDVEPDTARALAGTLALAHAAEEPDAALFEALPTAITVSEPGSERLLRANRAFLELVGREAHEVVGATPPFAWWAAPPERPVEEWEDVTEWAQVFGRPDGAVVHVAGRRLPLRGPGGRPERIVNVHTDLTDPRRLEQQLVQSGKLAALGELAAGVAHEINNPLFAILGLVEFLLKEVEPGTKAHDRLTLIQQTGLEIKEIVRALLDFARERSDEVALVSLEEVAAQTVELVRRTTSTKAVEIALAPADEPTPVHGSPNGLKQVVLHLLTNAQHAMPDGGEIRVAARREGEWAVLTVADTGPGIAPDLVDRIFDPFFTTKRDLGGAGLGLSVSLGIARLHGGQLTVCSEPGSGACFALRLPLARSGA